MKKQADMAQKGAEALDRAWTTFRADPNRLWLEPHQVRYLVVLREMFHTTQWTARLQYYQFQARELATEKGDQTAAEAVARRGLKLTPEARDDMARLLAERPSDPLLDTYRTSNLRRLKTPGSASHRRWLKTRTAVWFGMLADSMDFYYEEKDLETLLKNIPLLARTKDVPEEVLNELRSQPVFAVRTDAPIQVDGVLDESAWQKSYPRESFFVLRTRKEPKIALADTCVKTAYDDTRLYLAMDCRLPDGATLAGADTMEVFLQNPSLNGDYVHFFLSASGKARHRYRRLSKSKDGFVSYTSDDKWVCEGLTFAAKKLPNERRWVGEVSIPLTAVGAGPVPEGLRVNYARDCRSSGLQEISSILNPGIDSFHHVESFRPVVLRGDTAFVTEVSLQALEFVAEERTRTTGVATMVTFTPALRANRVLHNLTIDAEGFTADGASKGKRRLVELPSVAYSWRSTKPLELPLQDVVKNGRVRIALVSEEAETEIVIPFGG